ncbi:transcriptional adapter 1-like [Gigantopelta aegis]|uniref:transcriptional adapter 1-like n=1 Tax=Gigantopelta aegis TaxID=1735272 RepID=UPI001B8894A3|nr:transcriptional adapter 1-like [Gigantopelta aegis]
MIKMAASIDIHSARKNLSEVLGDSMKIYLHNLKSWFKQQISKEEFDLEARKLLTNDAVHLHNEFLLAVISRCQTKVIPMSKDPSRPLMTSSYGKLQKKAKLKRKIPGGRSNLQQRFVPANPLANIPKVPTPLVEDMQHTLGFTSRDNLLPDSQMIHGRILVCALESDLHDIASGTVKLVIQACEIQLKNIMSLVLAKKVGYKLREKQFRFAMGSEVKNPYLRQAAMVDDSCTESEATCVSLGGSHAPSLKPSLDIGEGTAAHQVSTVTVPPQSNGQITLFDLLETLLLYRSSIPCHAVYAPAVERAIHKLWHPSQEELDQDSIHKQQLFLKQSLNNQDSYFT